MGNSKSAHRHQSRSVPTSPEVRIRFCYLLETLYYIILCFILNNNRNFNISYFLIYSPIQLSDEIILLIYNLIGFLDQPYTRAVSRTYRPRSHRDFINCKIHLLPTVSIYLFIIRLYLYLYLYLYLPLTATCILIVKWKL